jgi:transposase InsO family protein
MGARTRSGVAFRILNIVDEFTRQCVGCRVDHSIGTLKVIEELELCFDRYGKPKFLRSDNGREFISTTLIDWLASQGIKPAFIEKGSPQQNSFVERFNGTMRDEVVRREEFDSVVEARVVIKSWVEEYNTLRPHRGLKMMSPAAFAAQYRAGRRRRDYPR